MNRFSLARVAATYIRRRSSSSSSSSLLYSEGKRPSTAQMMKTECHSNPLAEWVFEIFLPLGQVVAVRPLENRQIIAHDSVNLFGRLESGDGDFLQQLGQLLQFSTHDTACRILSQTLCLVGTFEDIRQNLLRTFRPNPFEQENHPMPGDGILRIGDNAQVSQRVLDVRGLDELEAPPFHEGKAAPTQLQFQIKRMETGTEQYGDVRKWNFLFAQFENFLRHEARLVVLALGLNQHRSDALFSASEQILGVALLGLLDDLVRQVENRLGATVVLLQFDDFRAGKQSGKLQNVAHGSAAEAVDRLSIIADSHD